MATAKKTDTKVVAFPGDPEVTAELSRALGLSDAELSRAHKELGRSLTHAELGVLALMWSVSESQKDSRVHTRRLPTTGPHVLRGLSDAAGALDLGDGYCAVVGLGRVHPVDNVGGAAPSAGDALRDVVALGARPIALLDSVRLGAASESKTASELQSLAEQLSLYARDVGVPVVGGDLKFEPRYGQQPLVQLIALGMVRTDSAVESKATGLGNTIVCVGTPAGFNEGDKSDAKLALSNDAIALKRLTDACLSALRLGSIDGAHSVGAAGVAGAALRLAESGSTGIELDLDAVARNGNASPYQLLCAAGGQRMLLVVKKGREDGVLETFRSHELDARVIGRVTNTERLVCKATVESKPAVVFDLPVPLLTRDAPSYERPAKAVQVDPAKPEITLKRNEDVESELSRLLGSANVGSREWLLRKLESAKNSSSTKGPSGDAVVLRATLDNPGAGDAPEKWVAVAVDGNARYLELDPRQGAAMAVAECARNLVCVGAEPVGLAHSLTLGSSDQPEAMFRLSNAVDGIRDACLSLKLPVIASSITMCERDVPSTPVIAVVGQLRSASERIGMGFGRQADTVALLGALGSGNLAGSEFVAAREPTLRGQPLTLDLAAEVKLQRAVLELARDKLLSSAHDVSEGGLGVALAECCIAGRIGCSVELPPGAGGADHLHQLFHEEPSRIVVSVPPEQRAKVQERCAALGVPFQFLGFVGGDTLEIEDVLEVPVQVLAESHSRALDRLVGE